MVADDSATNRFGRPVATRFPPEPNGFPHIGHVKSICLNFGIAREFGGRCNLRFDDTNPFTEDIKYVEAIKRDVEWLGFKWDAELYASDYFEKLYEIAEDLVKRGKAYVDSQNEEEIRHNRGTVTTAGVPGPYRDRSVDDVAYEELDPSLTGDACSINEARRRGTTMPLSSETELVAEMR